MRILLVLRGVVPISRDSGGAELAAYELARRFAEAGNQVTLVSAHAELDEALPEGLELVPVESRLLRLVLRLPPGFFRWLVQHFVGNLAAARTARRELAARPYDVVNTHGALETLLLCRGCTIPIVYTEHDPTPWSVRYRRWWERLIRKAVYRSINARAFLRATTVVPVVESMGEELPARFSVPAANVRPISNGTNVDLFHPYRPGPSVVQEQTGFDSYCLFVGRLTPRKAPDILLRALADVAGVNCAFVGDGPMRPKLEALARELGIADRVGFIGTVQSALLGRIYADADFLVLPSVAEGTPLVVIEAMACGIPVLAARVSGLPALVRDWETGFLVKPGDVGELTMAMRFLAGDPELRERLSHGAQDLVQTKHLWPGLAQEYLDLFESLAGSRTPAPERTAASA